MNRSTTRTQRATVACAAALAATVALSFAPANAADELTVTYDASGTSRIAKPGTTVALGPTVLTTALSPADGSFTGHLPLPDTRASFKALGLLPTTATVGFKEAAPVTGRLITAAGGQTVTSTASYYITLRNIKVAGFPVLEGPRCQTAAPVSIPANTPAGERFDLTTGGRLTGTYTIGNFVNCGFTTGLLNLLVPGQGNTVDIRVQNGRIG